MSRVWSFAPLAALLFAAAATAQTPQYKWTLGQTLVYRVTQRTTATESVADRKLETVTQLDLTKKWSVAAEGADGTATLEMSLISIRMETHTPDGETMLFDSAAPDKSHEALRVQMTQYVGPVLTSVRVAPSGKLIEVKASQFGPPGRLEAELPFKLILPPAAFVLGQQWERTYAIKLDPPQGAGESYDAAQQYVVKKVLGGVATVGVSTTLKTKPEEAGDLLPLLPLQPTGEVDFDTAAGKLIAVRFKTEHDVAGHRGEGSKYSYRGDYTERLIEK